MGVPCVLWWLGRDFAASFPERRDRGDGGDQVWEGDCQYRVRPSRRRQFLMQDGASLMVAISNIPTVNRGPRRPWDDPSARRQSDPLTPAAGDRVGARSGAGIRHDARERREVGLAGSGVAENAHPRAPPGDTSTTDQALEGIVNPPWFPPARALGGIRHLARCIISLQGGSMGIRAWSRSPSASVPCRSTNPRRAQEPGCQRGPRADASPAARH